MATTVWIVLQHRDGKLHRMSREALCAGQRLAAAVGGTAEAVLLGSKVEGLAAEVGGTALARVLVADDEGLAQYTPGGWVGALAAAAGERKPGYLVMPHTYQTVEYAGRLSQALDAPWVAEAVGLEAGDGGLVWRRPVLAGKLQARVRTRGQPVLVSVQSGAWPADEVASGQAPVEPLALAAGAVAPDREVLGVEQVAGEQVDLTQAQVIVAVGRGVGGPEKMEPLRELAQALGAELAASRPVIDNGWLPRDRQIGSSGQTVAPKLYLAAGISGAIQHLVGMKGSQVVVAINKDREAPIFKIAHYGIVGDLHEVVPALTAAVRETAG